MKLAFRPVFAVAPFALVIAGCLAQRSDVKEGTRDTIGAVKDAKAALSEEHLKAAMGDIEGLKAQIAAGNQRLDKLHEEANRRYIEQKDAEQKIGNLSSVALTVADFATNGRASTIVDRFTRSIDDNRERIDETRRALAADVKEARDASKDEVTRLAEHADEIDGRADAAAKAAASVDTRLTVMQGVLDSLAADTRAKLAKIDPAQIEALRTDLQDPQRFKERVNALLVDAGVAEADRNKILGMNPEEIMAILMAAGGSTYAARRMSKSQPQIDELYERQEETKKESAQLRATIAAIHGNARLANDQGTPPVSTTLR